jgi:GntR family transcriptional repressor for pyruvate dehydrogenase complex
MPNDQPRIDPAAQPSDDAFLSEGGTRLYQKVAARLFEELASGRYAVGDRLPAERELSAEYGVSRPAVREAMIALEVQGLIEVKVGSGAYVRRLPSQDDAPGFDVSAFEILEARLLFEAEAAALAALNITDAELEELEHICARIETEDRQPGGKENADRDFHLAIARATRNRAIEKVVEELWEMRSGSREGALLLEKARRANVMPLLEEHRAILATLRARDPAEARAAMRSHLREVVNHLLFAIEEEALAEARRSVATTRDRMARASNL